MLLEEKFTYIARHLAGELNAAESKDFQQWLVSDPEHMQLLDDATVLWMDPIEMPDANSATAWEKISTEIEPKIRWMPRILRAAMILIMIGMAAGIYWTFEQTPEPRTMVYESTSLDTMHVWLEDNSKVVLSANSRLEVNYPWIEKRSMSFSGNAFFDVEKDKTRPFEIETEKGLFQVLGTSFFVQTKGTENQNLLAVKEGSVRFVNKEKEQVKVEKGFAIKDEKKIAANEIIIINQTDAFWMHKKLFYANAEVAQVVQDLEKLYQANISVNNSAILSCKFSGKFYNNSLKEIIEIIAFALDLEVDMIRQNQFSFEGSGC